jgi:hypothetical protein
MHNIFNFRDTEVVIYIMYVRQLLCYARACSLYSDFFKVPDLQRILSSYLSERFSEDINTLVTNIHIYNVCSTVFTSIHLLNSIQWHRKI